MNDSKLVRFMNGRANLIENVRDPLERQAFLFSENIAERATVEVLHHEVSNLPRLHVCEAKVGHIYNVRVTQAACRTGFTLEALDKLIVTHELRRDEFQRDITFRAEVCGKKDGAHSTLPEQMFEAVFFV